MMKTISQHHDAQSKRHHRVDQDKHLYYTTAEVSMISLDVEIKQKPKAQNRKYSQRLPNPWKPDL